jgi:hypothetical protein
MDILAHAVYGATFCSRTGFAGGRLGAGPGPRPFSLDWTVWAAIGFGVLPDMASIGASFARILASGDTPSFQTIPPHVFMLYHYTHSLVVAGLLLAALSAIARPLVVPALAWPLHIAMDAFSHGDGRWQTLMLFPFSDWHIHGVNWWQHPGVMLLYWGALPVLWFGLHTWRRHSGGRPGRA